MIPESFVEQWRVNAKWQTLDMVEQDLVISRALIDLYNDEQISNSLVFRGGTALNKLFIKPASRYSEDIDFVQRKAEPIGTTIDKIRAILQPWLGDPKWKITERSAKLIYSYAAIGGMTAKLKIEINTTEHFQVLPLKFEPYSVDSPWFKGDCTIVTYEIEELVATKLRALYQRRKGRDLFDLWLIFKNKLADIDKVIEIFKAYCKNDGVIISQKSFQDNMELKRQNKDFQTDMKVLLPSSLAWNFDEAFEFVMSEIVRKV